MSTITHTHRAQCALLESLGLPHGTPVIEWHRYAEAGETATDVVPFGAPGWRYLRNLARLDPADYSAPALDDTSWPVGSAAFGSDTAGGTAYDAYGGYATSWALDSRIWVRRSFAGPLTSATVRVRLDNYATVYWNGVQVADWQHVVGNLENYDDPYAVTIPAELLDPVRNVLAIRGTDDATAATDTALLDVEVTLTSQRATPGWAAATDRTAALVDYRATHGRRNPLEAPTALVASATLARLLLTGPVPVAGERFRLTLGSTVAAALGMAETERPRFTGEITDARIDWNDDLTPIRVTAVGRSNRLGRVPLSTKRPQELDGERVHRILRQAAISLPLDIGTVDAGTVQLLAETYAGGSAAQAADQVRVDSLGYLIEHRSGRLDWHDAEHRRGVASAVTLTGAQHLIRPFSWEQTIATLQNVAEVTYGAPPDTVRVSDAGSVEDAGPYAAQLTTRLADELDAYALATNIVGRYARPSWTIPDLTVDVVRTAGDTAGAVLSLSCGDKLTAEGLPPDGPFTAGALFVEGTTETFTPSAWRVSLTATDPTISGVGLRWLDVPPLVTWNSLDPELRWLDAALIEDGTTVGDVVADGGTATAAHTTTIDGGTAAAAHTTTIDGGQAT